MATLKKVAGTISAEGRKRIADAQKKRWATKSPATVNNPDVEDVVLTPEAERKAIRNLIKKYTSDTAAAYSGSNQKVPETSLPVEFGAQQLADQVAELSKSIAIQAAGIRCALLGIPESKEDGTPAASEGPLKDHINITFNNLQDIADSLFVISSYLGGNQ